MARVGFASGVVVAVLIGPIIYLLGIASPLLSLSIIFLIAGIWTVLYGVWFTSDKVYWIGWGGLIAILSTFYVLPLQYTAALVLIVIVGLIIFTSIRSRNAKTAASVSQSNVQS